MTYSLEPFRGIFPAALTMFDENEELDEESTAKHWDWLIRQGVQGLVITGTSGEFIALKDEERLRLFKLAKSVVAGRVPVIYGTGHYSTKLTIEFSEAAVKESADAVIIILPYYQKPPKPAVVRHFRDVRARINVPIMLYNNPANSACADLDPQEVARLVEEDVVHLVKSTYETVVPVHDLSYLVGDKMAIFYGSFMAAFEGFTAGAHGWTSGILNVVPKAAIALHRACVLENDARKGFEIWKKILDVVHIWKYQKIGPVSDLAIYRSILKAWGLPGGYCRHPFYALDEEQERSINRILRETGWIDPDQVLAGLV